MFSTHYHELTNLEDSYDGIKNYKLGVREFGGTIVFIRKLLRGRANKSFGIEVAALSGLKIGIIDRAKELLSKLEKKVLVEKESGKDFNANQTTMFKSNIDSEIIKILSELDLDSITPRHAHDILADLKRKL